MIKPGSVLWQYLGDDQRRLASDGEWLIADRAEHPSMYLSDYSYLVFPFSKLYEGFLKQLFLDIGCIGEREYKSDHFRIGKTLSPNLSRILGPKSAYASISRRYGEPLAFTLWTTWKQGRNLVFHYFPHNYRRLSFDSAQALIAQLVSTMEEAVATTHLRRKDGREYRMYR